jgi:hypothetical protein
MRERWDLGQDTGNVSGIRGRWEEHMERRILGRTGLEVSAVGFGGGGIGQVWGQTTDEESMRAIGVALERGVTFFDVARATGMVVRNASWVAASRTPATTWS